MRRVLSTLCAAALTVSVAAAGVIPTTAAPLLLPTQPTTAQPDVIQVQVKKRKKPPQAKPGQNRPVQNRPGKRPPGFYHNNNQAWYNGRPGYRTKRSGYRYYNGWWFPAGAFIAGAVVGGAVASSNSGSAHVRWCYDRYKSYREYDNTWQPYEGPRRQCISPYS